MIRLTHVALLLLGLSSTSCYLAHRIDDPDERGLDGQVVGSDDGGPDSDGRRPPGSETSCCLELTCGETGVCGEDPACGEGPACGGACCGAEELCVASVCVAPGGRCSNDSECESEELCDTVGRVCVPVPATGCFEARRFAPEIQWEDRSLAAITVPIVTELDGDGVPDIVTIEVPDAPECARLDICPAIGIPPARLVALSGDDGHTLFTVGDGLFGFCSHTTAAAGDLDGDGTVEIVVFARSVERHRHVGSWPRRRCMEPPEESGTCPVFPPDRGPFHDHGRDIDARYDHYHDDAVCSRFEDPPGEIVILSHEGEVERRFPLPFVASEQRTNTITIADLDADGGAEIIAGGLVIGAEGIRWSNARLNAVGLAVGDIDLDGQLEIVTPHHAFEHDGTLKWTDDSMDLDGHPVIARVLSEPASTAPQVIVIDAHHLVVRDGLTGEAIVGPERYAAGVSSGPPTVADFDGDGVAELAVAADHAFVVFDFELGAPFVRWQVVSQDRTPGTVGSAAFDFDGDGADDVVYADECHVNIFSGRDGTPLWTESNPSRTVWEYPVVADVDGDGHAELVVVSNGEGEGCAERDLPYRTTPTGLRVFRDRLNHWSETRSTWNQHGYSRSIGEDGRVPVEPPRGWLTHNTVRGNPHLGERGRRLPNLRVTAHRLAEVSCGGDDLVIEARVENRGNVGVEAGVEVALGALALTQTTGVLLPGAAEWVRFVPVARARVLAASPLEIRVDPRDLHTECDEHDGSLRFELRCVPDP